MRISDWSSDVCSSDLFRAAESACCSPAAARSALPRIEARDADRRAPAAGARSGDAHARPGSRARTRRPASASVWRFRISCVETRAQLHQTAPHPALDGAERRLHRGRKFRMGIALVVGEQHAFARFRRQFIEAMRELADAFSLDRAQFRIDGVAVGKCHWRRIVRSEEHTSELQSLMRISYAVFCLKKKK